MKYIKYTILLCLYISTAQAQRQQRPDTLVRIIGATASGTANQTADGTTYLFNNAANFSFRKKDITINGRGAWVYGESPEKVTNNDVTAGGDFNLYKTFPGFYYWGLINFMSSYSLNIRSQSQTGLGVAYQLIDRDSIRVNISNGVLVENSHIIDRNDSSIVYQTVRNSLRVHLGYTFRGRIVFNSISFWQPSFLDGKDYIITNNTNLDVRIWKWLSLTTRVQYNHISRTEKENLLFTYGLKIDYKF